MRVSLRQAILLFIGITVFISVWIYPSQGECFYYRRTMYIKDIEPMIDPDIQFGDPGDDPHVTFLGSNTCDSIEAEDDLKPIPENRIKRLFRDTYRAIMMKLITRSSDRKLR